MNVDKKRNSDKKTGRKRNIIPNILWWTGTIFLFLVVIGYIVFELVLWTIYGAKTITEIPAWVIPFLFGGGRK